MYASGIPMGMLIDSRGPRWGVLIGAIALACGYFPLYSAFERGPGSVPFGVLCLSSFLSGLGSCSAFSGCIKTCATNWPQHRGTATAFPLSGFGLSAFAFTMISGFAFPDNTGSYLLLLALGTFTMVFTGMFFLRMNPPTSYQSVPTEDGSRPAYLRKNSSQMQRSSSRHSKQGSRSNIDGETGRSDIITSPLKRFQYHCVANPETDETSSLISCPGDIPDNDKDSTHGSHHLHKPDITGWQLPRSGAFWKLFILLGLLCGVGLMTIK